MEIVGLAYAKALQELIVFAIHILYVVFFLPEVRDALQWPTSEVFQELGEYFRLGIPALIIFGLPYFCLETFVFIAGTFSPASQAAASFFVSIVAFHDTKKESFGQAACA